MNSYKIHPSSYKDPAGFVFEYEEKIYRQVNKSYADNYILFQSSNLYFSLVKQGKLISHEERNENLTGTDNWYITLLPEQIPFISYPYEWCFDQLRDAALLTLDILKTSLDYEMILKDATPFNVQFIDGKPVFIDTLSFEKYDAAKPWVAYRQFVECFIIPLVLATYKSTDFIKHLQLQPQGISTAFAARILPFKCRFRLSLFLHIYLSNSIRAGGEKNAQRNLSFSKQKLLNIINNLTSLIRSLKPVNQKSDWNNYYDQTILSETYLLAKLNIVKNWLKVIEGNTVIDIGTNTGAFAFAAAEKFSHVIALDTDERCINDLFVICKTEKRNNIYPLWVDITNPTPGIGWVNKERESLLKRLKADVVLALAVIHHLIIGKNISLHQAAALFSSMGKYLIIEFVPKADPKVVEMLKNREDIFHEYNEQHFESCFSASFIFLKKEVIESSGRVIYLMQNKQDGYGR